MKPFEDNPISTMTIIATINCKLDVGRFFQMVPITFYEPPVKTRGRKKKDQEPEPIPLLKPGSIVSVKYRDGYRGAVLKKVKTRDDGSVKFFRNQATIDLVLEEKWINIKIFNGEKTNCTVFQLTGCKSQNQCERGIAYLWDYIRMLGFGKTEQEKLDLINPPNEMILTMDGEPYYDQVKIEIPPDDGLGPIYRDFINNDPLMIVLDIVMINTDYHLGFSIDRKKLNNLMNHFNGIVSAFEPAGDTGVNIRMFYDPPKECMVDAMVWNEADRNFDIVEVDKFEFYKTLPKKKKQTDQKRHTFLVFRKGKVIQSGCYYPLMKEAYKTFMNIVTQNAHQIIEDLTPKEEIVKPTRVLSDVNDVNDVNDSAPPRRRVVRITRNVATRNVATRNVATRNVATRDVATRDVVKPNA